MKIEEVIDYIKNTELLMDVSKFFDEDGNHITKRKYGELLIDQLCIELKDHFKDTNEENI